MAPKRHLIASSSDEEEGTSESHSPRVPRPLAAIVPFSPQSGGSSSPPTTSPPSGQTYSRRKKATVHFPPHSSHSEEEPEPTPPVQPPFQPATHSTSAPAQTERPQTVVEEGAPSKKRTRARPATQRPTKAKRSKRQPKKPARAAPPPPPPKQPPHPKTAVAPAANAFQRSAFVSNDAFAKFSEMSGSKFVVERFIKFSDYPHLAAHFQAAHFHDIWKIENKAQFYPNLVRQFYANLTSDSALVPPCFDTVVQGTKIRISVDILGSILHIPTSGLALKEIPLDDPDILALIFTTPPPQCPEFTSQSHLTDLGRLLNIACNWNILPKTSSPHYVSNEFLRCIYALAGNLEVNWAGVIYKHMSDVLPKTLVYPNLITRILRHFRVRLATHAVASAGRDITRTVLAKSVSAKRTSASSPTSETAAAAAGAEDSEHSTPPTSPPHHPPTSQLLEEIGLLRAQVTSLAESQAKLTEDMALQARVHAAERQLDIDRAAALHTSIDQLIQSTAQLIQTSSRMETAAVADRVQLMTMHGLIRQMRTRFETMFGPLPAVEPVPIPTPDPAPSQSTSPSDPPAP